MPVEQHKMPVEQVEKVIEKPSQEPAISAQPSVAPAVQPETPSTESPATKEATPATPTTPSSVTQRSRANTATSATKSTSSKSTARPTSHPAPAVPTLPKAAPKEPKAAPAEKPVNGHVATDTAAQGSAPVEATPAPVEPPSSAQPEPSAPQPAPVKAAPTSWANLFSKPVVKGIGPTGTEGAIATNGGDSESAGGANSGVPSFLTANANSVGAAIQDYRVGGSDKISFLEPRGLINTGNMCYMNSVGCTS